MKYKFSNVLAATTMIVAMAAPTVSLAQSHQDVKHRQQKKNEWKNLAIGSGALAIIGLVSKNGTLTMAGTAGTLYSAYRYEQDRKSESKMSRARAQYYSRPYIVTNGTRYDRKTVWKGGKKYYTFVRHRNG